MKMTMKVLSLTLLTAALILEASDGSGQTAAQKNPFSELDKAVFYNKETQKMETPYSTASVKTFSKDTLVTIEEDAYNKLHTYAKERSKAIATANMLLRHTAKAEGNGDNATKFGDIMTMATESHEKFNFMKPTGCHSDKVQLSQHNLMHLLQWSTGITTVWLTMTGSRYDFLIDISLGKSRLLAPQSLRDFIIDNNDHAQKNESHWLGEEIKS